jgi:hypothetical protein
MPRAPVDLSNGQQYAGQDVSRDLPFGLHSFQDVAPYLLDYLVPLRNGTLCRALRRRAQYSLIAWTTSSLGTDVLLPVGCGDSKTSRSAETALT